MMFRYKVTKDYDVYCDKLIYDVKIQRKHRLFKWSYWKTVDNTNIIYILQKLNEAAFSGNNWSDVSLYDLWCELKKYNSMREIVEMYIKKEIIKVIEEDQATNQAIDIVDNFVLLDNGWTVVEMGDEE